MNMKHGVNLHGILKLELECHCVDLFHNGEWAQYLVIQFFWRSSCFDVLLLKPNLISNLEIGWSLQFMSAFSLYYLWTFSRLDTNCVQMFVSYATWSSIVGFTTLFTFWMSNLGYKPWFTKNGVWCVIECIMLL